MVKKYNYFYKTTNMINGKFYYGVRTTDNLNDGYIGCGVYSQDSAEARSIKNGKGFILAVKKYGYENFKKEIISFYDTKEEAYEKEIEIVNEKMVNNPNCYNISLGGMTCKKVSKFERHGQIWAFLYNNTKLTMKEIGEMYQTSHPEVSRRIKKLKKKDKKQSKDSIKVLCLNNNKVYPSINQSALDTLGRRATGPIKDIIEGRKDNIKGFKYRELS